MEKLTPEGARLMETLGGGFASALSVAYQRADGGNRYRLERAFPELIAQYNAMARVQAKRAERVAGAV